MPLQKCLPAAITQVYLIKSKTKKKINWAYSDTREQSTWPRTSRLWVSTPNFKKQVADAVVSMQWRLYNHSAKATALTYFISLVYKPASLEVISQNIQMHMEEATKLERQNKELQELLQKQSKDIEDSKNRLDTTEKDFANARAEFSKNQQVFYNKIEKYSLIMLVLIGINSTT